MPFNVVPIAAKQALHACLFTVAACISCPGGMTGCSGIAAHYSHPPHAYMSGWLLIVRALYTFPVARLLSACLLCDQVVLIDVPAASAASPSTIPRAAASPAAAASSFGPSRATELPVDACAADLWRALTARHGLASTQVPRSAGGRGSQPSQPSLVPPSLGLHGMAWRSLRRRRNLCTVHASQRSTLSLNTAQCCAHVV